MNQKSKVEEIKKEFQSLTKKELWIEVEEIVGDAGIIAHALKKYEFQPKITDGKIKAIWK